MRATRAFWQHRQPMIRFLGKRHTAPPKVDHTPHVHPASPAESLPESFAQYRVKAQQHGPLNGRQPESQSAPSKAPAAANTSGPYGAIGGHSGRELGSVEPKKGEFWDRSELPARFRRTLMSEAEMDAIHSGGASVLG